MVVALPILPLPATVEATVKLAFSAATSHNGNNENPTAIPFGRLQNRKSQTITNLMP
jgi:hypothetical protein